MSKLRGALIVLEGLDRCGKSTQCELLLKALTRSGRKAELVGFPDRRTLIGAVIDKYLNKEIELNDRAIHLLFCANRWENESYIRKALESGTTIVIDRYSYSGVAYSSAKEGMTTRFCAAPEDGLPSPDIVYFIDVDTEELKRRGSFGSERYEKATFLAQVAARFEKYKSLSNWKVIDGSRSIEDVHREILNDAEARCQIVGKEPIRIMKEDELGE